MQKASASLFWIALFILSFITQYATAQNNPKVKDPLHQIHKFDDSFNGIGPKVYLLPEPRTKEEIIRDFVAEKAPFTDTIASALIKQQVIENFLPTANQRQHNTSITPLPSTFNQWDSVIQRDQQGQSVNSFELYAHLNQYAKFSFVQNDPIKAIELLKKALFYAQKVSAQADITVIKQNISSLLIFSDQLIEARSFENELLQAAEKQNLSPLKGQVLLQTAIIHAKNKEFNSAQQTIIRKAIPHFNRTKDFIGKMKGLIYLSQIYQMEKKFTEAQWFLLQARDIATSSNFKNDKAEIEYLLAVSKFHQQNFKVAQNEFLRAKELAEQEDNKLLKLAIEDRLTDIYFRLGNHKEARNALENYWSLKEELF